jgi:regulator of RNase E activity RraA
MGAKAILLAAAAIVTVMALGPRALSRPPEMSSVEAIVDGYRHVEVASVSDAMEKLTGQRVYLSHRMRPIFPAKFAGLAVTVKLKKEENHDANALDGMLAAIDHSGPNSVYVMAVEDGANIAGMGGLMGTAMQARNFSGFPVFSTGPVPSTSVGHYRFDPSNTPLVCDGIAVSAGDIVAADADGVVIVPRAKAAEVLATAQEMDFKEHSMYAYIEKLKSIEEAVKRFGRL